MCVSVTARIVSALRSISSTQLGLSKPAESVPIPAPIGLHHCQLSSLVLVSLHVNLLDTSAVCTTATILTSDNNLLWSPLALLNWGCIACVFKAVHNKHISRLCFTLTSTGSNVTTYDTHLHTHFSDYTPASCASNSISSSCRDPALMASSHRWVKRICSLRHNTCSECEQTDAIHKCTWK